MKKRYFIKNLKDNSVNYVNVATSKEHAYKIIENQFKKAYLNVDIVNLVDGFVEIYYEGKQLITLKVIEQDLGATYIADIERGSLVKAYFDNDGDAVAFLERTYDSIDYDYESDMYYVTHKDTFIGGFVVIGGDL